MGFLKAVAVVTGSWIRTAITGARIEINSPDYPNEITIYSGNPDELVPGRINGSAGGGNVGAMEMHSPELFTGAGTSRLELEGFDDGHTTATLAGDFVRLEAADSARVIGFGSGVRIGSDIGDADSIEVVGNQVLHADLRSATNQFPSIPYGVNFAASTDASGNLVVTHGAGFTPSGGWAIITNPQASFAQVWGIDSIGATTARLRFTSVNAFGPLASTAVAGRLFLVR